MKTAVRTAPGRSEWQVGRRERDLAAKGLDGSLRLRYRALASERLLRLRLLPIAMSY